ncbi:YDG domain-containing protein At5g47150-like [Argentina anserina]|uniref:YDG domain-containing protein At5g47150-like n=1 Tax=Argentina anserina TaxID=57926 RepID=UPI0021766336|nr:YDG domain-containing protein At5g47150-like [Potentilla anserina]
MGSEGVLQHLELLRRSKSVGEHRHKETILERSVSSRSKFPDHKRARVSAVRDFPPGCGRLTELTTSAGTSGVARKHHVGAVRDFPPQCGRSTTLEARNFDQVRLVKGDKPPPPSNTTKTNVQKPGALPDVKHSYTSWWRGKVAQRPKPNGGTSTIKKQPQLDVLPQKSQNDRENIRGKSTNFRAASLRNSDNSLIRKKVTETLSRFRDLCIEIERKKLREGASSPRRIYYKALKMLKEERGFVNTGSQIMGEVPGVEIGDKFRYRVELTIVGLHRQTEGGIDYTYFGRESLATSVVASGGYADDMHDLNSLTYTGHGGSVMHHNLPGHQELKRGNLALKNSIETKNPVRVIYGSDSLGGSKNYVYVGLYSVEKFWKEMGGHGKFVYKFQLNRIPGQSSISLGRHKL